MDFSAILNIAVLALLIFFAWDRFRASGGGNDARKLMEEAAAMKEENRQLLRQMGELRAAFETERSEKDRLEGKGKQMFAELTALQHELRGAQEKNSVLEKEVARFKAEARQRDAEFDEKLKKLEHVQKSLEDEKSRVRREDEERQQQILDEKNRIWNDHENAVLSRLRDVCQKPEVGFRFYENKNLPADFDGSLKPDFLIEFLGQYLIFDAKKSKDISTYLPDQAKKTATKLKGKENIYPVVFFVVPTDELQQLRKYSVLEEGIAFFAISAESIEPILANFRKMADYENLQDIDPMDRENLVNLIAGYDQHISFRNAAEIWLTRKSIELMDSKESLSEEWREQIEVRKQQMRPIKLKETDIRQLSTDLARQQQEAARFTSPRAAVAEEDSRQVKQLFESL